MERYAGHVSWERVVSGQCGFRNLFDYLLHEGESAPETLLEQFGDRQDIGSDLLKAAEDGVAVAEKVLRLFVRLYGAQAGNLALTALATSGVFIAGGIAPRIVSALKSGEFIGAFNNKGRFQEILRKIPVHVVTEPNIALLGAAYYAAAKT